MFGTSPAWGAKSNISQDFQELLSFLPCSNVVTMRKGEHLYEVGDPADSIFVVTEGTIKVTRVFDGREVVIDLYRSDDVFGECALLPPHIRRENATALEWAKAMSWRLSEVQGLLETKPGLAAALAHGIMLRSQAYVDRIATFAAAKTDQRIAYALIRFQERFGRADVDGYVRLIPLTHDLLANYVLTSRELVTICMNRLRADGCLRYHRSGIFVRPELLREWLQNSQHRD